MTVADALAAAVEHHRSGRLGAAEALYRQIIAVEPQHADALHLLGVLAHETGHHEAAARLIGQAIALNGDVARYHNSLGDALRAMRRGSEALQSYDRAIQLRPSFAVALCSRGNVLHQLGRFAEALANYDRAIQVRPNFSIAHYDRARLLQDLNRQEEALASYDRAIAARADFAEALSNRGNVLQALNRFPEAVASYDRAVNIRPNYAEAFSNRGSALEKLQRYEEAMASFDRAIALQPHYSGALSNRGIVLHQLQRFDEALASFADAQTASLHNAEAHFGEAEIRLLLSDFDRGWEKYEWRSQGQQLRDSRRGFTQPQWLGRSEITGKTILLHAEQGFGDTIQFCRYVPLVAERGARVILEVQPALTELMTSLAGTTQVVSAGSALPDFDVQCPLLSLPLAFATRLETIPSAVPYLRAASPRVLDWDAPLGPNKRRPRIGLAWSGRPTHTNDRNRSIPLGALSPLLDDAATFVSLQKNVSPEDAIILHERGDLLHFGDALTDFSATAALIANLDLVISVDTSVAHLAGALAKPVWILLPFTPDWRWLLDRLDSPWYPTARLFRQDGSRAWDSVIARIKEELHKFVQGREAI